LNVTEERIHSIIQQHDGLKKNLIAILLDIQEENAYLPPEALRRVAAELDLPLIDVIGLATFYRAFSLKPRGKHRVSVCLGTACHVRGAPLIVGEFEQRLGVRPGETTADCEFTLETVNCLGACALGPVVVADTKYFSKVKQSRVDRILARVRSDDGAQLRSDPRVFPLALGCPHCGHSLLDSAHPIDDHPSVCLTALFDGRRWPVRLSSLYGSYAVESEHEVPLNALLFAQVTDLHDRDDLAELLADLLERRVVAVRHDDHARQRGVLGAPDNERVNVEAARGKHSRDVGENARLILNQHGEDVFVFHAP
jgi:NADH-quinone oxidoreductase subunit E